MEAAVASTSRVTLDAIGTVQHPYVTKVAEEREIIVISSDEEEIYDSDSFTTPPLPPQASQVQVEALLLSEPAVVNDDTPSEVVKAEARVAVPLPISQDSDSDSLFDPNEGSSDEEASFSESETVIATVQEVVKKRRGRPPGRRNGEGIKRTPKKKLMMLREVMQTVPGVGFSATNGHANGQQNIADANIRSEPMETIETIVEIEAPESPKALLPDFVFEPPDESMFAELRAFLDQEEARSSGESSDEEDDAGEEERDDDYYERKRLRKLQANNEILSKLGLAPPMHPSFSREEDTQDEAQSSSREHDCPMPRKIARGIKAIKVDADGTTTSVPPKGTTFEAAYIDMPVLRNRIRLQYVFYEDIDIAAPTSGVNSDGSQQWIDVSDSEKEAADSIPTKTRKRRQETEGKDDCDVGESLMVPQKKRRILSERARGPRGEADEGEGTTCHQCRRKTLDPKMRCRYHEEGRVCPLYWCRRCLDIRYGIEFDEDSRTFECPRCSAYCNCSLCLHRAGLQRFVPDGINNSLGEKLHDKRGVKKYHSVKHYIEAQVGREFRIGPGGLLNPPRANTTSKKVKAKVVRVKKIKERKVKEKIVKKRIAKVPKEKSEGKRRGRKPKIQETGRPVRKIRLTLKRQEHDANLTRKPRQEASNQAVLQKKRKMSIAEPNDVTISDIAAIKPDTTPSMAPRKTRKNAKQVQAATVWVKSKADAFSSSDSESEAGSETSTLTSLSSEMDEDCDADDLDTFEKDAEALEEEKSDISNTDAAGREDQSHDTHQRSTSPSIGHVEYYAPPSTDPPFQINDRTSTPVSSESDWNQYQTSPNIHMAGYPSHSNRDLASIMCQLRESGLA